MSYLSMEYRYAAPESPGWTDERLSKAGYSRAVFMLPTRKESPDAKLIIRTPNREFIAEWSEDALPTRRKGAFQLTGEDVREFARELTLTTEVQVEGSLARYPSLDGTVIRTTNAGNAISDFVSCASQ